MRPRTAAQSPRRTTAIAPRTAAPSPRRTAAIAPRTAAQSPRRTTAIAPRTAAPSPRRTAAVAPRAHRAVAAAAWACVIAGPQAGLADPAAAPPPAAAGLLAVLAPPPDDDARRATAIGPNGEVYEPDGKGGWLRRQRIATADTLELAGRAGGAIVAIGDGVVYRLAGNGWSAIRLVQKGKAVMSSGPRAIAAVGRQLFALDRLAGGEPAKLALAPHSVLAIGSGRTTVIATERGLHRLDGARLVALAAAPRRVVKLVGDGWALVDRGAHDLRTGRTTAWPAGLAVGGASPAAAVGDDGLAVIAAARSGGHELVTVRAGKLERDPITVAPPGVPVGVVVDRAGRAVVAFRDGRLAVRADGSWTVAAIAEALPGPRPGAAPAASP